MKDDILIVGAMKMEVSGIKGAIHTGFGRERTYKTIYEVLKKRRPSLIISVGVVGAVSPELKAGDIFIPEFIVDYEKPNKFKIGAQRAGVPVLKGTLVTVHKVFEKENKYNLKKEIPEATAVDMETSAVCEALGQYNIPLLCVKAVCDELDYDFSDKKLLGDNTKLAINNYTEYIRNLLKLIP